MHYAEVVPIGALIGPRQVGKTTLALVYAKRFSKVQHFDIEAPIDFKNMSTRYTYQDYMSIFFVFIDTFLDKLSLQKLLTFRVPTFDDFIGGGMLIGELMCKV